MIKPLVHIYLSYLLLFQPFVWAGQITAPSRFISHIVDPVVGQLAFYWRDADGKPYQHFLHLKQALAKQEKTLTFAMNGGIYQQDLTPLGLYIEKGEMQHRLSRRKQGHGNFYIQPNGVFYLTKSSEAGIVTTSDFKASDDIDYATQSGPMLLVNGKINPNLTLGSTSLRIRNGVGILPNGHIVFAISRSFVNFYDFADYFKQQGCEMALYLDGSVSRLYLPAKSIHADGRFGVIIGQTIRRSEQGH